MSTSQLIEEYLAGPTILRAAVTGMTADQLRARPIAGRWSTLEVLAHLSDFEPILVERMKRIIALDRPLLLAADENLFAKELAYHEREPQEELALIEVTRSAMGRILKHLPSEAFARQGVHSYRGLISLEETLRMAVRHIHHHLPFIQEKKAALGIA